ncbi:phage late control D family protein [Geodermatophilus sp. URMC 60]
MAGITYTVMIDDAPAAAEIIDAIEHIECEDDLGKAALLRLHLGTALSEDGEQWLFADDGTFARLSRVQLLVATGTGLPAVVFDGYVVQTELSLSEDPGGSAFTVIAMDATALMNLEEKVREWPNMPDSAIATAILGEYTLAPVVDDTQPVRTQVDTTVIQRDTDIQFLRHLAQRNGFDVYVRPGPVPGVVEGHFHRPAVDDPAQGVLSVAMGEVSTLRTFSARYEMLRPAAATASGVDARTVTRQPAESTAGNLTELGATTLLDGNRPRTTLLRSTGESQAGALQTLTQAAVDRSTWAVTVDGELDTAIYGDVLRTGGPVLLRGAGSTYSGTYYVQTVRHRIEGERYTQHVSLRRNAVTATGREDFLPKLGLPT